MQIEFYQPAEDSERYALHAFDSCIGKNVPFTIEGVERSRATVVSVTVNGDGTEATWVVDIADPDQDRTREVQEASAGRMSFSFRPPARPSWFR